MKAMKGRNRPEACFPAGPDKYPAWFSEISLSTGIPANSGLQRDKIRLCHNRPMRTLLSAKGCRTDSEDRTGSGRVNAGGGQPAEQIGNKLRHYGGGRCQVLARHHPCTALPISVCPVGQTEHQNSVRLQQIPFHQCAPGIEAVVGSLGAILWGGRSVNGPNTVSMMQG